MIRNEVETKTIVTKAQIDLDEQDLAILRTCHAKIGSARSGQFGYALYVLIGVLLGEAECDLHHFDRAVTRAVRDAQ